MNRGEGARLRIANQNRNTVSRFHGEKDARRLAYQRVAILIITEYSRLLLRIGCGRYDANISAVHLPTARQGPIARKQFEKAAAVLVNIFGIILVKAGQVQRV